MDLAIDSGRRSSRAATTREKAICGVPICAISRAPLYATDNTPLIMAYQWRTNWYATDICRLSVAYHHWYATDILLVTYRLVRDRYVWEAAKVLVAYHAGTPLMMYLWRTKWYTTDIFRVFFIFANLWNIQQLINTVITVNNRYSNWMSQHTHKQ